MDPSESIRMNVGELTVDPASKTPIVILRDEEERITLPIWIGAPEAHAIASELEGTRAARPQTHDLISSILDEAEVELLSVSICDLRENMYHAEISLRAAQKAFSVEARPSDAIALALRTSAPIYVARELLDKVGLEPLETESDIEHTLDRFYELEPQISESVIPEAETGEISIPLPQFGEPCEDVDEEKDELTLLQHQLQQAVLCEEYEEAARLRDAIETLANRP